MVIGTCLPSPIPTRPSGKSLTSPLRWQARIDAKFVSHDISTDLTNRNILLMTDVLYLAGKPIPGFLCRVLTPDTVLLALNDRAPQLTVSEDRSCYFQYNIISIMLERLKMVSKVFNLHTPSVPWSMCVKKNTYTYRVLLFIDILTKSC